MFVMTRGLLSIILMLVAVGSQSRVTAELQPSKSVHDFSPERGYYAGLDLNRKTPVTQVTQKFLSNWSLFILIRRPSAVTWPARLTRATARAGPSPHLYCALYEMVRH